MASTAAILPGSAFLRSQCSKLVPYSELPIDVAVGSRSSESSEAEWIVPREQVMGGHIHDGGGGYFAGDNSPFFLLALVLAQGTGKGSGICDAGGHGLGGRNRGRNESSNGYSGADAGRLRLREHGTPLLQELLGALDVRLWTRRNGGITPIPIRSKTHIVGCGESAVRKTRVRHSRSSGSGGMSRECVWHW